MTFSRIIPAAILVATLSSPVLAGDPKKPGPEKISFKMGAISLEFQHKKHTESLRGECFHCHKSENGKIDGWGKETAHTLCIPCHDINDKGPVECNQCHGKN